MRGSPRGDPPFFGIEHINTSAQQFRPDKIILFGSYAYGTPNEDSDVDLLVAMPADERDHKKSVAIQRAVRFGFPCDLSPTTVLSFAIPDAMQLPKTRKLRRRYVPKSVRLFVLRWV